MIAEVPCNEVFLVQFLGARFAVAASMRSTAEGGAGNAGAGPWCPLCRPGAAPDPHQQLPCPCAHCTPDSVLGLPGQMRKTRIARGSGTPLGFPFVFL